MFISSLLSAKWKRPRFLAILSGDDVLHATVNDFRMPHLIMICAVDHVTRAVHERRHFELIHNRRYGYAIPYRHQLLILPGGEIAQSEMPQFPLLMKHQQFF
ncbi:hypothetical protein ACHAW5_006688 [Stephanodiscus triporus]|uniref:Uncharacterized protein n=1 Tax=Stephanodiscus triporus TaxID=2934178 RepID=A0ABD3QSI4_9STRA